MARWPSLHRGDPLIYEHLQPLLSCFGRLFHVGDEPGMAQTMKIINNLISVTSLAITSGVMVLGAKAGLDVDAMIDVLNASSGRTSASVDKVLILYCRAVLTWIPHRPVVRMSSVP